MSQGRVPRSQKNRESSEERGKKKTDLTERLTESLIDSAWVGKVGELFADELHELELLEEEEEKLFQAELRRTTELLLEPLSLEQASADVSVASPERKDAKRPKKRVGTGTKRPNADAFGSSTTLSAGMRTLNSSLNLKKERETAFLRERGREREQEFWHRTLQVMKQRMHQARDEADAQRLNALQQQRFFCARGIDDYTMDEVLQGAQDVTSPKLAAVDGVSEITQSGDAQLDEVLMASSDIFAPSTTVSLPDASRTEATGTKCEFTIDAKAFASNLNAALEREYGFRPVLSSFRGRAVSTCMDTKTLRGKLLTHAPGDMMHIERRWQHSTLPPVSQMADEIVKPSHPSFLEIADDKSTALLLPPISRRDETEQLTAPFAPAAPVSLVRPVAEGVAKTSAASRTTLHPDSERTKASSNFSRIECSAKENRVTLQTTVGAGVSRTVRFINRDPNLLCVRIRPSKHAWVTYSMVKSSLDSPRSLPSSSSASPRVALNKPLVCGGFVDVQITFYPRNTTESTIGEVLHLLHSRDLNSRRGEGAKWHSFDVKVQCETILPQFRLIPVAEGREEEGEKAEEVSVASASCTKKRRHHVPQESKQAVTKCEFPYTYVMDKCTRRFCLENTGSDAVITLCTTSPCFQIDPLSGSSIFLSSGGRVDFTVCFAPVEEKLYDAEELVISVLDSEQGCNISQFRFGLLGEGMLPHVALVSIGELELGAPQPGATVPQYIIPSTTVGVETEVVVTVRNNTPVALSYFWRTDTVGGGREGGGDIYSEGVHLCVTPVSGVFFPHKNEIFCVRVNPTVAQPFVAVLNLFLQGFSTLSSGEAALGPYSRNGLIPALPGPEDPQRVSDPYNMFQHCLRTQPEDCCGVFATGFYLFGDPMVPSLVIIPNHLEEVVECLVHYRNVRRIVLQNNSSRPLHFCFDPRSGECPSAVVITSSAYEREDVEVEFEPRTGCVPPHASVGIAFRFIVRTVGFHALSIDCYIPELMELLTTSSSDTEDRLRCSHQLHLSVTGIGPSVRVSTDCLDFGLIELGGEAEASFTVTNDNPIPVVFDLQDPMMREPRRFVFLPHFFRLGAGESVEVTVYRQAVEVGDSQTFFELNVQGGGTLAIETRATIQAPMLLLEEAVVNFGVVPEEAWVERSFVLFNTSAFDIAYTVEPLVLPSWIKICTPPPGVVRAGLQGVYVPVRCAFGTRPKNGGVSDGGDGCEAVLLIKNTCTPQELLVELRCESVQQLAVTVDLIPVPKGTTGVDAMAYAPPQLPNVLPPPPLMEVSFFIEALLWNLVELEVFAGNVSDADDHRTKNGDADLTPRTGVSVTEKPPVVLRPYCPPVVLKAFLPDKEPVWSELVVLRISNQTDCQSVYAVDALHYPLNNGVMGVTSDVGTEGGLVPLATTGANLNAPALVSGFNTTKNKGSRQKKRKQGHSALSVEGHSGDTGTNSLGAIQHAFWCKSQDGTEMRERERRAMLVGAQKVLLDGRGCATIFGNPPVGPLCPGTEQKVVASIFSNFPGQYDEILRVSCGKMPPMHIPLTLELSGKPVLLDSKTAGLAVLGGRELMVMPAVIAGVGRSRRSMFVMNRVPRDLNVCVNIFLTASTFAVVAVDGDVNASAVTLQLQPISEEEQQRESEGKGKVLAFPENFLLPAMASREVVIEYAPDAFFVSRDGLSEREWRGGVIITAEVANTPFNDGFLINEFYRTHAARYPAERVVKTKRMRESEPAWMKSIVRPIAMLKVKPTLISRPGVVKNNVILQPTTEEMTFLSERFGTSLMSRSGTGTVNGGLKNDCRGRDFEQGSDSAEDSSDDDDEGGDEVTAGFSGGPKTCFGRSNLFQRTEDVIIANDEERRALCAFIEQRRGEIAEQSRRCFIPIELELRARCGIAQLSVEPPGSVVHFPRYVEGESCEQVLQLTNQGCAAMEFILNLSVPSFRILSTRFVLMDGDVESLEADDEEAARLRQAVRDLKWISQAEQRKVRRMMSSREQHRAHATASMDVTMTSINSNKGASLHSDSGFVTVTKYRLCPQDVLEVRLEYCESSKARVDAMLKRGGKVEATLEIMYLPTSSSISQEQQEGGGGGGVEGSGILFPSPVLELTQTVPLAVTFASPSVTCRPPRLWFRPGQQLHDGRPQPSYAQKLQLVSSYPSAVRFKIVPSSRVLTGALMTDVKASSSPGVEWVGDFPEGPICGSSQVITRERQIREMTSYWKVDGSDTDGLDETDGVNLKLDLENSAVGRSEQGQLEQQRRQRRRQQQRKQEEQCLVVEDADRFVITPMQGVIPCATRGGQPGVFEISVTFKEHVNVRFKAGFDVLINDRVTEKCNFILCGDSRETEI